MSETRRRYFFRLIGRIVVFALCLLIYFLRPEELDILEGMNFFDRVSIFHVLWVIWVIDMILQVIPLKNKLALGSQKLFLNRFRPIREKINYEALKTHVVKTTMSAYRVMIVWVLLVAGIGCLYLGGAIGRREVFLISVFFYVCDLICVLVWCPFRLMMGNKCCTTCRIFNWDHLMMFSPFVFIGGFFPLTIFALAVLAWLVWELCVAIYPERFSERTNTALRCSECTDKLCTQYCQKIKKTSKGFFS